MWFDISIYGLMVFMSTQFICFSKSLLDGIRVVCLIGHLVHLLTEKRSGIEMGAHTVYCQDKLGDFEEKQTRTLPGILLLYPQPWCKSCAWDHKVKALWVFLKGRDEFLFHCFKIRARFDHIKFPFYHCSNQSEK